MLSLAERHADRAQRKADNAAFSNQSGDGGAIGVAAFRILEAQDALRRLTPEQLEELKAVMPNDGFNDASGVADAEAYDNQGNLKTAGIGVVNPLIAPVAAAMAIEGAQTAGKPEGGEPGNGGWGSIPEPAHTPAEGNQNGAALAAQTGAGGGQDGQDGSEGGEGSEGAETGPEGGKRKRSA